ncbi:MAG: peptidase M61 [Ignavibacteria bacterium]|nr:peptidase M61 [Ignavibacteria bacterium]
MKKHFYVLFLLAVVLGCYSCSKETGSSNKNETEVTLDLVNVTDDRVKVVVKPPTVNSSTIAFQVPKIIPGTYAIQDYGRYIDDFKAFDKSGNSLPVSKKDVNTWVISEANKLDRVEYLVNDTFDEEVGQMKKNETVPFSPAGTNINKGENFFLNLGGFVGYFENQQEKPFVLTIEYPRELAGTTAMVDADASPTKDVYRAKRFAELIDNPIMYAKPDISTFTIGDMEVVLHVYSPRNTKVTSQFLMPALQKTMIAQKDYLGPINKTKRYAVLVYLTAKADNDAQGTGALEHNSSTTGIFEDDMKADGLDHTISHEFFHTLTPLNVHSKEIQYFDFNNPKMSQHLWMYEGFTEYFSVLFRTNKGFADEQAFYDVLADKMNFAATLYNDQMSLTEVSKNVVDPVINKQFGNFYNKGTLAAMCLDIIIREKSNGERGILSVMGELSNLYGADTAFSDDSLIPEFTKLTYPEVGEFLQNHVVKNDPIDYGYYLAKVGVSIQKIKVPVKMAFSLGSNTYFNVDPKTDKVFIATLDGKNEFLRSVGFQDNDEIVELRGVKPEGAESGKLASILAYNLKDGDEYTAKVIRNGEPIELRGKVKLNQVDGNKIEFTDKSKAVLKDQWLYK